MNKKNGMYVIILLLLVGTSFILGVKYQEGKIQIKPFAQLDRMQRGMGEPNISSRNRMGFRPISGKIIALDEKSFTVKLEDESSKIILFSAKTNIIKAEEASKSAVKIGERVMVMGTANADGSVTAQNIQLHAPLQPRMQ